MVLHIVTQEKLHVITFLILPWVNVKVLQIVIDDPDGILEQYGSSCSELAILACDADLSDFIAGIGFGISVYEICPESCGDCGEGTAGCTEEEACNYNPDATTDDGSCDYGVDCFVSPCSTSPSPFPGATCVDDYCDGCCAIWTWTNEQGMILLLIHVLMNIRRVVQNLMQLIITRMRY